VKYCVGCVCVLNEVLLGVDGMPANYEVCEWIDVWCVECVVCRVWMMCDMPCGMCVCVCVCV